MDMQIQIIPVKSVFTKSKLPAAEYAINPYVGCPHRCRYCYACFMKRFTKHEEPWGTFLDVKDFPPIKAHLYEDKQLFFGSVTDVYNPYEEEYRKTEDILKQLAGVQPHITISTKSKLVCRDVELFRKFNDITIAFSINTLDDEFRRDMDHASSIRERLEAMEFLHNHQIRTAAFISPIFPEITNVPEIAEATHTFCDEYWLENLNLRGSYKADILHYIHEKYPKLLPLYQDIYTNGNKKYWIDLSEELDTYARQKNLEIKNYFYHELIRKPGTSSK